MSVSHDGGREKLSLGERLAGARAVVAPAAAAMAASAGRAGVLAGRLARRCFDGGYDGNTYDTVAARGAITLNSVTIAYGRRVAVENLTGSFQPGSLTAIVGPNGGGKSSLLKGLAGLKRPRRGGIDIDPVDRRRLAFLPQQTEIDQSFPVTVSELVSLGGWRRFGAFRRPPELLHGEAGAAILAVGLDGLATTPIVDLSPGQFRRALFARLIVENASIVLLDEPFAAIDDETVAALLPLLAQWRAEGRTVMAVLHDLDQARAHFPASLLLARTAIAWGSTDTVLTPANMAQASKALGGPGHAGGPPA
jgi:zinc/manganese transport system ATP-binding protein